jgi:hypothetical protein
MIKWLAASLVFVATASSTQSCDGASGNGIGLPGACWVDTRGVRQEGSLVTEVVTAKCDGVPAPKSHTLEAWFQFKRSGVGGDWRIYESKLVFGVPDATGESAKIAEPCRTGEWMPYWKTYGVDSTGKWFSPEPDHDLFPTTVECQ